MSCELTPSARCIALHTHFSHLREPFTSRRPEVIPVLALLLAGLLAFALTVATAPVAHGAEDVAKEAATDAATKDLIAAAGLYRRGQYKFAAQKYEAFLKDYPGHKETATARYALAICEFRQARYAEAITQLETVLKTKGFPRADEALAVLGHCQMTTKHHEAALKTFERIQSEHGSSRHAPAASINRVQVLHLLGRKKDVVTAGTAFLKKYNGSGHEPAARYFLAVAMHDLEDYKQSSEALQTLLKQHPQSRYELDALLLLGQCAEATTDYKAAVGYYTTLRDKAPAARQPEALYNLAVALHQVGDYEDAAKSLSKVLAEHRASPFAKPAMLQLGLTQLADGKPDNARATLTVVAKEDKDRAIKATYWLAQCDIAQQKYKDALQRLDSLAKAKPAPANIEQVLFDRAACNMAMGEHKAAADQFAAYRKQYPKSTQGLEAAYRQAFCQHQLKQYEESLALCGAIAKLNVDVRKANAAYDRSAAELLAENLFLLARYEPAAKAYADLLKSADAAGKPRLTLRLGQCAYQQSDFTKAIGLLKPLAGDAKVLADERLRDAVFLYGDALLQTAQYKDAVDPLKRYRDAIGGKAPRDLRDEVNLKLGLASLRSEHSGDAEKYLQQVIDGSTESPWVQSALFEYGQQQYKQGNSAKAEPALSKVVAAKAPAKLAAPAMYLLAWIKFDAKDYAGAAAAFKDVTTKHPGHELAGDAVYQQGVSLYEAEKHGDALPVLAAYLKLAGDKPHAKQANFLSAKCLTELKRHEDAGKVLASLANAKDAVDDKVLYDLAWNRRAQEANDQAEAAYRKLMAGYDKSDLMPAVRAELADLLRQKKSYDEAAKLLELVVADDKADASLRSLSRYQLAWCYEKLSKPDKAAPLFAAYAQENAKSEQTPAALYQAGLAFATIGQPDASQAHLAKLIQQFPKHELTSFAHLKLGQVYADDNKLAQSAAIYTAYLQRYPKGEWVYLAEFGLGWAHEGQKKYDEARKWYRRCIDGHNGETAARAQFQIGETYFTEGKYEDAVRELLSVASVYQYDTWSARSLYEAGRALVELKRMDEAKKVYAECVKDYAKQPEAEMAAKALKALP